MDCSNTSSNTTGSPTPQRRHKFWQTQPVKQFEDKGNSTSLPEGPIENPIALSEVKKEPYKLTKNFEWVTCDVDSEAMMTEKLRSKGLGPLMIKDLTRRVHSDNIWQAAYATGVVIPTPVSTCQISDSSNVAQAKARYALPESTSTQGLREMKFHDVLEVTRLLKECLSQFNIAPVLDEKAVEHWLLPKEDVMESYVVESPETHEITDYCSFFLLPIALLENRYHKSIKAAYSLYSVSTKTPLAQMMKDALIVAKQKDYDVFSALDVIQNQSVFEELKCRIGDGRFHYYLDNYRINCELKPSEMAQVLM
ncbi:Myristoyl-CoA:protein N-myristoyltransferase [Parasponia andersonii]|uniref:Glycylpeptide N-tetradecanoyltransferase n=1 Tax=Parasponia andersonii TaxID=3476 RepID=A0A2P5BH94_PARAD|nr:Myristoyl-CoA:protein N-myristoyltransferase [Parasponia andersonii]